MTKKHFIALAHVAKRHADKGEQKEAYTIYMAVVEANDNKLFDAMKFRIACGIK